MENINSNYTKSTFKLCSVLWRGSYIDLFKSSVQSIREHLQSQVQKLWSSKINPIRHQPPRIMVNPDPEAETYLKGIAENQPSEMDD